MADIFEVSLFLSVLVQAAKESKKRKRKSIQQTNNKLLQHRQETNTDNPTPEKGKKH